MLGLNAAPANLQLAARRRSYPELQCMHQRRDETWRGCGYSAACWVRTAQATAYVDAPGDAGSSAYVVPRGDGARRDMSRVVAAGKPVHNDVTVVSNDRPGRLKT
jgi:acyl-homoserine lactone acylase PvdQ